MMRDIYINSNLNPFTKFASSSYLRDVPPMEHPSNEHEDHPNQHENSHKLCDETGNPVLSLLESQWKLRQHDQTFPIERKPL